jgi:L-lactate dehydrogenase (cytochrome)
MVGRPYLYGLMAAGEPGVDRTLEILRVEYERTLRLLGLPSTAAIGREQASLRSR